MFYGFKLSARGQTKILAFQRCPFRPPKLKFAPVKNDIQLGKREKLKKENSLKLWLHGFLFIKGSLTWDSDTLKGETV